jgi:hypothetical protein
MSDNSTWVPSLLEMMGIRPNSVAEIAALVHAHQHIAASVLMAPPGNSTAARRMAWAIFQGEAIGTQLCLGDGYVDLEVTDTGKFHLGDMGICSSRSLTCSAASRSTFSV